MKHEALFEAYCRDELDDEHAAALRELLAGDVQAQEAFAAHLLLHCSLSEASAQLHAHGAAAPSGLPRRRSHSARRSARRGVRRRARRPGLGALAVGLVVVAVVMWLMPPMVTGLGGDAALPAGPDMDAPLQAGALGPGASFERDGERHAFDAGTQVATELQPGDRLRAEVSAIRLRYADGTSLELAAGSELLVEAITPTKRLQLVAGSFSASVAAQPEGAPLVARCAVARRRGLERSGGERGPGALRARRRR